MPEKRKDSKGRLLAKGESQRADLTYQYRYTDEYKKRRYIYAPTLKELREKEDAIQKKLSQGFNISELDMTMRDLSERYLSLKTKLRSSSILNHRYAVTRVEELGFGQKRISDITTATAKEIMKRMIASGDKAGTIRLRKSLLHAIFQLAVEDDLIPKNPFQFNLDFIPKSSETEEKDALTQEQQQVYIDRIKSHPYYKCFYNPIIVLLNTGLRIGELCGLTLSDVDFEKQEITVARQLKYTGSKGWHIGETKTENAYRTIPMNLQVYKAMSEECQKRKRNPCNCVVDGVGNFIFTTAKGKNLTEHTLSVAMKTVSKHIHSDIPTFPQKVTPHILRHTFCSNMIRKGTPPKLLQYLMGHANVDITLSVYAHVNTDDDKEAMKKYLDGTYLDNEACSI